MKCTIPEISWHNRDPVLSIDIEPKKQQNGEEGDFFWRLATGGADSHVLIWHLTVNEVGVAAVACVADLNRHLKAVNVVRFSPNAEILASGDDESVIILWKQKEGSEPPPLPGEENINKEQWTSWKVLKGHLEDVYDISWSPDSSMLVSGSVDNTAIVWDAQKGRSVNMLRDYKGFVQGVAWDPCNQYIATLSTDRHCRLIDVNTMKTVQKVHKAKIPTLPGHPLENKVIRLFYDDTFKSFFRRLTFSIDGSFIIAPSGIIEPQESSESLTNATMIFSRHNLKVPIMLLPSLNEITIAVKCCPIYFELRSDGPVAMIALPYRLVFAVATQKSVLIYDTQQISPIAVISNIHYTRLTDVVWSSDGRILMVSSTDGYCSIIHFEEDELGKVYSANKPIIIINTDYDARKLKKKKRGSESSIKRTVSPASKSEAMSIDVNKFEFSKHIDKLKNDTDKNQVNEKLSNGDENMTKEVEVKDKTTTQLEKMDDVDDTEDLKLVYDISAESSNDNDNNVPRVSKSTSAVSDEAKRESPPKCLPPLLSRTPRRVQLITLSSPNRKKRAEK